ncbi:MAG: hypothetical protein WC340_17540 [Kiritimatiellia bacterium]|jgi:hypothetical protein
MIDFNEFAKLTVVFFAGVAGGIYFGREFLIRHIHESIECLGGFFTSYGVYRARKEPEPAENKAVVEQEAHLPFDIER